MAEDNEKLFGDKKIPFKVMVKRLAHYVIPEWKSFALAFLLIIFNVGLDIVLPLFIRTFTDSIALSTTAVRFIIGLAVGYFSLSFIMQISIYFESMLLQKAGTSGA